eukprot:14635413-Heterocapsa_arctica.AAC.1
MFGIAVFPFLALGGELVVHHRREVDAVAGARQHSVGNEDFHRRWEHRLAEEQLDDGCVIRFGADRVGAVVDVTAKGGVEPLDG